MLCLLLLIPLASHAVDGLCLPHGLGPEARKNIDVRGRSVPLGIVSFTWTSPLIESEIYRIIAEEVLGLHTAKVALDTSLEGFYLISGCPCTFTGECFGEDPLCSQGGDRWHILMGDWESYDFVAMNYVYGNFPKRYPTYLGDMGYPAWDAMFLREKAVVDAFRELETPLEYYRGYNISKKLSPFFSLVTDIPLHRLRPCNETRMASSLEVEAYAGWTGDWAGLVSNGRGGYRGDCSDQGQGYWWLAPACRDDVQTCIPFLIGSARWPLYQWMLKAASYHMPLALAVTASWDEYQKVPFEFQTMFYWWYPDSMFTSMRPLPVAFPPHNQEEWAQGNSRTASEGDRIQKWAWHGLKPAAGRFVEVARRVSFTKQTADRFIEGFVKLQTGTNRSAAEVGYEIACDWVRQNEVVWRQWVPLQTNCVAGRGLVRDATVLGDFVTSRDEATGCQWCATGRFSAPHSDPQGETHVCKPCPLGSDQSFSGQLECIPCRPGRFKANVSNAFCEDCVPGRATDLHGQTVCPPCPTGTATAQSGGLQCDSCTNGTVAEQEGQPSCSLCGAGRFAEAGGSHCSDCSLVLPGSTSMRGSASDAECSCPSGTYLAAKQCEACPEGLLCPGGNGAPLQRAGFWVDVSVGVGGRDAGSDSSGSAGSSLYQHHQHHSVYSVNSVDYGDHTYRCRDERQCPAGALGSCAPNRRGTACNNCEDGHFTSDGGGCEPCAAGSILPLVGGVLVLPMLFFGALLFARGDPTKQHLSMVTMGCIAGQAVMCMQALSALHQVQIDFPKPLRNLLDSVVMVMSFDILNLPCILTRDAPVTSFAVQLVAYPLCACLLLFLAGILKFLRCPLDSAVLLNTNGTVLLIAYITMTMHVLLPFQCQENPGGFLSMVTEPGLKCFQDPDHIALSVLGVLGILAYPVAIGSLVVYATLRYWFNLRSAGGLRKLRGYRFLFVRFRPEHYYFGVILLVRNCLVTLIPVILVRVPGLQVLMLVLVLLTSSLLHTKLWPWRTELANLTELVTCAGLTMTAAGVGFLLPSNDPALVSTMGWTLSFVILFLPLFAGIVFLRLLYCRLRPVKPFGIFLCHHKAGAGVLCRLLKTLVAERCTPIFIDSDFLDDLDNLFDIVRSSVANLVVVLSQRVLLRAWCAGEIVTAYQNRVGITALTCEDFTEPSRDDVQRLVEAWTDSEFSLLASFNISRQMVCEAYGHLLALPRVQLSRFQDLAAKQEIGIQLARDLGVLRGVCGRVLRSGLRSGLSSQAKRPVVLVTGAVFEGEWLVACELMQVLLEEYLELETEVLRDHEVQSLPPSTKVVVIILSQGLLRHPGFESALLKIFDPVEGTAHAPHVLTALGDPGFKFPPADFYSELEKPGKQLPEHLGVDEGPYLAAAYHTLLSMLSKPFTPLASDKTIRGQVAELGKRVLQVLHQPLSLRNHSNKRSKKRSEASVQVIPCVDRGFKTKATVLEPGGEAWVGEEWAEEFPDKCSGSQTRVLELS